MGWTFMNSRSFGKQNLIDHLIAPSYWGEEFRVLGHSVVGNHLWAAVEHLTDKGDRIKAGDRFIFLALMQSGLPDSGWGYKDLDESMGPCAVDCPLKILELAGTPRTEGAAQWREQVRQQHRKKAETKSLLKPGSVVSYEGIPYRLDQSLGRKGWFVTRATDGAKLRMTARQANEAGRSLLSARALA